MAKSQQPGVMDKLSSSDLSPRPRHENSKWRQFHSTPRLGVHIIWQMQKLDFQSPPTVSGCFSKALGFSWSWSRLLVCVWSALKLVFFVGLLQAALSPGFEWLSCFARCRDSFYQWKTPLDAWKALRNKNNSNYNNHSSNFCYFCSNFSHVTVTATVFWICPGAWTASSSPPPLTSSVRKIFLHRFKHIIDSRTWSTDTVPEPHHSQNCDVPIPSRPQAVVGCVYPILGRWLQLAIWGRLTDRSYAWPVIHCHGFRRSHHVVIPWRFMVVRSIWGISGRFLS